jgi:hypothetical protein
MSLDLYEHQTLPIEPNRLLTHAPDRRVPFSVAPASPGGVCPRKASASLSASSQVRLEHCSLRCMNEKMRRIGFRETRFCGAETTASKKAVTSNRSSAETKRPRENPPVRPYLHDTGKSLFAWDCVVGLGGLEPGTIFPAWPSPNGRKDWTSALNRASVSLPFTGRMALHGIIPRWRCRHCGASVVTALDAVATERDPKCRIAKSAPKPS